ncbi:MAG: DUF3501 family protein [Gammaproteobacteria bacterium]|nr:DUF3501 family protein [Gammaproteobacteria bacterium]MDJ0873578.1 DUF3501 family protein [Gammaproteobacteria bacterium]
MNKLTHGDLQSLEEYARVRSEFRREVIAHKRPRRVSLGPNAALYFEDALTIKYQVQEMLRVERIFEPELVQDELDAYNPLIPDGSNWKATFMVEFSNAEERRTALARMIGVEDRVWVRVAGFDRVWAVADEDLDREDESKTSSVHFVRFELTPEMAEAARRGADISAGVAHDAYTYAVEGMPGVTRDSLAADLH